MGRQTHDYQSTASLSDGFKSHCQPYDQFGSHLLLFLPGPVVTALSFLTLSLTDAKV